MPEVYVRRLWQIQVRAGAALAESIAPPQADIRNVSFDSFYLDASKMIERLQPIVFDVRPMS